MANSVKKERFEAVQVLRLICFMQVFIVHSVLNNLTNFVGVWALEIFFIMSGFMMVYSYCDRELPSNPFSCVKFGYKRVGKLYPLHVETTLIQLCMIVPAYAVYCAIVGMGYTWQQILQARLVPLAVNLGLLQDWVPDMKGYVFSFNGPSWFLSAMVFAYALFPLIMRLLKRLKTVGNVLAACVIVAIANGVATLIVGVNTGYTGDFFTWFTQHSPFIRILDFFMGCAVGWIFLEYRRWKEEHPSMNQKPVSRAKWTVIEIIAILLIPVQELYGYFLGTDNFCRVMFWCRSIMPVILSVPVLLVFILNRGYITKALCRKPLLYLGNISMYMYLIHYVFCNAWSMKETAENWTHPLSVGGTWIVFVIQLALTILCSIGYDKLQKYKAKRKREKLTSTAS